jgi:hypothetical protein
MTSTASPAMEEVSRNSVSVARPSPIVMPEDRRISHVKRASWMSHSPRWSGSSFSSTTSSTPLFWNRPKSLSISDPEKTAESSQQSVEKAIADDLAVVEPLERDYHRQSPYRLLTMIWYVTFDVSEAWNIPTDVRYFLQGSPDMVDHHGMLQPSGLLAFGRTPVRPRTLELGCERVAHQSDDCCARPQ